MNSVKANLTFRTALMPLNINNVKYIVIHHIQAKTATPEQIHQWHLGKGWSGAGYNEYIRKDGSVYILRGDHVGAHCADAKNNYNPIGYGIACEGDYEMESIMPLPQMKSLVDRIKHNKSRMSGAKIVKHKELTSTSCPGKNFPWNDIIKQVESEELSIKEALSILSDNDIVSSRLYWYKKLKQVLYLDKLIINMAKHIKQSK